MTGRHSALALPQVYRLWQAPFAERKFAPVRDHNDLGRARHVLDVGCGPGTNVHHFGGASYIGLDLSPAYAADARRRTGRTFLAADATALPVRSGRFDFVLLNSLLHHIDTAGVRRVLAEVGRALSADGHVHILDLVRPSTPSPARLLAALDRGDYARPEKEWRALFEEAFHAEIWEPYAFGLPGVPLWHMVYFKGRAIRNDG